MGSDGSKEWCLTWGPDVPWAGAILGKGAPIVKYRDTAVTSAKIAEPIVMQFGLWGSSGAEGRCHGNQLLRFKGIP